MSIRKIFEKMILGELYDLKQDNQRVIDTLNDVAEIKVFNLEDGKPFAIVIKSDDIDQETLNAIKKSFIRGYGDCGRKVAIVAVGQDDDVNYLTLKEITEKAG